jgi:predicted nucleic acid-binding protein
VSLAVVDASALVAFYVADDPRREVVVTRLGTGDTLLAPAHLDVEVVSALRGLAFGRPHLHELVPAALRHLADFPVRRLSLGPLLARIWDLRQNLTAYGAAYVALAERLEAPVITCDARLATAPGTRCRFDVI